MQYNDFMTYTISISNRKMGYFPEELLKKMKIKGKGKIMIFEENNKWIIRPVKDIMEFAGMISKENRMPANFDFRKQMEENYNEPDRL